MRNEYTITKKLMKSWAKGWCFNSAGNMFLLFLMCGLVAFAIYVPYLFFQFWHFLGYNKIPDLLYSFAFYAFHIEALLILLLIPFIPLMRRVTEYNIIRKNYSVKEWQRVTEFTEDEIIVTDHKSIFKYQYRTIRRVKERGNVVYIFLKSGTEIIIHKDAFVSGSWDECKKLISQKSRVKIK